MIGYCALSLLNFDVPVGPWHKYATYFYNNILERVRTTQWLTFIGVYWVYDDVRWEYYGVCFEWKWFLQLTKRL